MMIGRAVYYLRYHGPGIQGQRAGIDEPAEVQVLEAQTQPHLGGDEHQQSDWVARIQNGFPDGAAPLLEPPYLLCIAVFIHDIVEGTATYDHRLEIALVRPEERSLGTSAFEKIEVCVDNSDDASIPPVAAHFSDGLLRIVAGMGHDDCRSPLVQELAV